MTIRVAKPHIKVRREFGYFIYWRDKVAVYYGDLRDLHQYWEQALRPLP